MNKGTPADPLPAWEDPRVQIVYTLLCADEAPPDREEHWEGWIARRIVAALATKPAETADRVERLRDAIEGECDGLAITVDHARAILEYVDDHPTESAGKRPEAAGEARQRLHDWSGTIVCDVMDWFSAGMRGPLPALPEWAETQRSLSGARSDERTISDPAISGLSDTRLETERGAVQPPAPEPPYADIHRLLLDVLSMTGIDSRTAPDYAVRVAAWLPDSTATTPSIAQRGAALTAARQLFDNRLGWGDGRNPYAPRELWADLGAALYGEDDPRVVELRAALSPEDAAS